MRSGSGSSVLLDLDVERRRIRQEIGRPKVTVDALDRVREESDIVSWAEQNFYIDRGVLISLLPHQKCVLRYALQRNEKGRFRFPSIIYSAPKKQGKSTACGVISRWFAETQTRYAQLYCAGNDAKQAKERSFQEIRKSIELTPGYLNGKNRLPGRWQLLETTFKCLITGSAIQALSLDARGEAGSAPALTIFTEAWGMDSREALKFWAELTPVPTVPDSLRIVDSYAGFQGESELLFGLYERGLEGRQITVGELAKVAARNRPGESYEELLHAFAEADGDPTYLAPVWIDDAAGMFTYWDTGSDARRMPMEDTGSYYRNQAATLPPNEFLRLHENQWVGSQSAFVPIELWNRCQDLTLPPLDRNEPCVIGLDAAVSDDCFAITAVSRHPQRPDDPALRAIKVWVPPKGSTIDFDQPEAFLRWLLVGGCPLGHPPPVPQAGGISGPWIDGERAACPACQAGERVGGYKILEIAYDAFQAENMMGRFRREYLPTHVRKFQQGQDRLVADKQLYHVIVTGRLGWNLQDEDAEIMRQHIRNADVKLQKNEDSKMRIVKKNNQPKLKIDLCVALAQAVDRCLYNIMS